MKLSSNATIILAALSLLHATAIANRPDAPGIKAQITKIYAPYHRASDTTAWWQHPIYSAATRQLIRKWEAARNSQEDELGSASDADWLCNC
jgi:hypothetical protein